MNERPFSSMYPVRIHTLTGQTFPLLQAALVGFICLAFGAAFFSQIVIIALSAALSTGLMLFLWRLLRVSAAFVDDRIVIQKLWSTETILANDISKIYVTRRRTGIPVQQTVPVAAIRLRDGTERKFWWAGLGGMSRVNSPEGTRQERAWQQFASRNGILDITLNARLLSGLRS